MVNGVIWWASGRWVSRIAGEPMRQRGREQARARTRRLVEARLGDLNTDGTSAERDRHHGGARRPRRERGAQERGRGGGIGERRRRRAGALMHGVVREPAGPLESVGRELVAAQPRAEYLGQARGEIAERFESLDAPGTIRRLLEDSRRRPEAERRRIFTARQSLKPRSLAAEPLSEPVRRQVGQFPESADAPAAETR